MLTFQAPRVEDKQALHKLESMLDAEEDKFLGIVASFELTEPTNACLTVKEIAAWVLKVEDLVCDNNALALIELQSTKRLKTVLTQRKC